MAGEFILGMHGDLFYEGARLAGLYAHEQVKMAEKAGVAKGTLYRYFESKADLYVAALDLEARGQARDLDRTWEAVRGSFLLAVIIVLLVALMVRPAKLDVYKTVDEIEFADASLASCVQRAAVQHGWQDVGHIVSLRCNHPTGDAVVSLDGIEHLVSLTDVNLAFNAISDISALAELPNLTVVDLSHNLLTDIPVMRSAGRLERLELNYNRFETLDWLAAQNFLVLQSLSIAHNDLDSLAPLLAVTQLRELNVRNNRLVDIEPVFALTDLELADLGGNRIASAEGMNALANLRRLFLDRTEAITAALADASAGDVVVIRYEGPKGGPGMQEMLYPTSYIKSRHLGEKCALITDGRFSGGTAGACIGHVSPEAAAGGAIGLLDDGDIIQIDIPIPIEILRAYGRHVLEGGRELLFGFGEPATPIVEVQPGAIGPVFSNLVPPGGNHQVQVGIPVCIEESSGRILSVRILLKRWQGFLRHAARSQLKV